MRLNRRRLLSLMGMFPALLAGSPALANASSHPALAEHFADQRRGHRRQANPYYQVVNMSYVRSISIEKWV